MQKERPTLQIVQAMAVESMSKPAWIKEKLGVTVSISYYKYTPYYTCKQMLPELLTCFRLLSSSPSTTTTPALDHLTASTPSQSHELQHLSSFVIQRDFFMSCTNS